LYDQLNPPSINELPNNEIDPTQLETIAPLLERIVVRNEKGQVVGFVGKSKRKGVIFIATPNNSYLQLADGGYLGIHDNTTYQTLDELLSILDPIPTTRIELNNGSVIIEVTFSTVEDLLKVYFSVICPIYLSQNDSFYIKFPKFYGLGTIYPQARLITKIILHKKVS